MTMHQFLSLPSEINVRILANISWNNSFKKFALKGIQLITVYTRIVLL